MTNLKRIIDEKGVQQRRLAEQVGVTEVSMSRYVSGERIPKAPIAIRIADTLGVDVKELYGWDDAHVIGTGEDMTTEEAAEVLRNAAWLGTDNEREQIEKAVEMAINVLTAQPEIIRCHQCGFWDRDTLQHNVNDFRDWNEAECLVLAERDGYHEINRYTEADDFCSRAERKTDGN